MDLKRLVHTIRYCTLLNSTKRANYIRKKKIFGAIGENVYLPFMVLPLRYEKIYLHNNIEIASGAKLILHDAIHGVFNRMANKDERYYAEEHIGKIEIFDNVFVGANAIIIGPCKIGPNVIIGAGAVVCGDIEEGSIVAGIPAKKIGQFDNLYEKRRMK